jgi:hypothetical protein
MGILSLLKAMVLTVICWAVLLTPLWVYLGVRRIASPEGFWQELVLGVVGVWFGGFVQLILAGLAVMMTLFFWGLAFE